MHICTLSHKWRCKNNEEKKLKQKRQISRASATQSEELVSGVCLDAHVLIIKFAVHLLARKLHETSPHLSFRHIKGAFNLSMLYGLIRLGVAFTMPSSLLIIF
jgi:hypothetical protein